MPKLITRFGFAMLAIAIACCSAQSSGSLQTGMTADQAVSAMGQPDLRDNLPDPSHSGATVQRYTWLTAGKAAVFNPDNRVASIQDLEPASTAPSQPQPQQEAEWAFDPINTPLNYAFYPVRAALIYIGAGVNCLGGGGCRRPQLPPVNHG